MSRVFVTLAVGIVGVVRCGSDAWAGAPVSAAVGLHDAAYLADQQAKTKRLSDGLGTAFTEVQTTFTRFAIVHPELFKAPSRLGQLSDGIDKTQRQWAAWVDAECKLKGGLGQAAVGAASQAGPLTEQYCLQREYAHRIQDLRIMAVTMEMSIEHRTRPVPPP